MAASADSLRLGVDLEATRGTINTNPVFDLVRTTGEGLQLNTTSNPTDEISPDRGVTDSILEDISVSGDINFELAKSTAFETLLAMFFMNDWAADELTIGSLLKSATIEKRLTTNPVGPVYAFQRFNGCLIDGFTLTIEAQRRITGTFSMVGRTLALDTGDLAGATHTSAGVNPVMTANRVIDLDFLGGAFGCAERITLTGTNNIRALNCIGVTGADDHNAGRMELTLSADVHFESNAILQALLDQSVSAVRFRAQDTQTTPASYLWEMSRVKINAAPVSAGGVNTDVIAAVEMTALHDAANTTFKCTRA